MLRVLGTSVAAIVLAGVAMIVYTGRFALDRAESNASAHTSFVARTIARQNLRLSDFRQPVTAGRRTALDRLFSRQVLIDGALRVKLYGPRGLVTYSNAHDLIGTRPGENTVEDVFRTQETATDISHLDDEGGTGPNTKALETYAPMVIKGRRVGVIEIYQDYGPVAAAASSTFWPVAAVLGVVLFMLYLSLFPLLAVSPGASAARSRRSSTRRCTTPSPACRTASVPRPRRAGDPRRQAAPGRGSP